MLQSYGNNSDYVTTSPKMATNTVRLQPRLHHNWDLCKGKTSKLDYIIKDQASKVLSATMNDWVSHPSELVALWQVVSTAVEINSFSCWKELQIFLKVTKVRKVDSLKISRLLCLWADSITSYLLPGMTRLLNTFTSFWALKGHLK